jgi:hypothetical protein
MCLSLARKCKRKYNIGKMLQILFKYVQMYIEFQLHKIDDVS